MELYLRFISTLAFGLVGLGVVLKVLMENLFNEWDMFNDIAGRVSAAYSGKGSHVAHLRAEDILLEAEKKNAPVMNTRIVDLRRKQMQEMGAVEARLTRAHSGKPVTESDIGPS